MKLPCIVGLLMDPSRLTDLDLEDITKGEKRESRRVREDEKMIEYVHTII